MARSYRKEYDNYQGTPEQIERRAARNKARRMLEKNGKVRKGDGKDVDHKNGNPKDNRPKNLTIKTKTANRSFPRNSKAGKK